MRQRKVQRIEHVLQLIETHGPASAYAYIQRTGLDNFPPTLVAKIRLHLWSAQRTQQRPTLQNGA